MADGTIPAEVRQGFADGLFQVPPPPSPLGTSAVQSTWNVPVLLIGFLDAPIVYSPASFDEMLFDTTGITATGSAYDYYKWVSEGRLSLRGRVVAVVQLPHNRDYYAFNAWGLNSTATPNNIYGMIRDALIILRDTGVQVDWIDFDRDNDGAVDMLWVVHAGTGGESTPDDHNSMWSITSRLSSGWRNGGWFETNQLLPGSTTQHVRIDRFSTLPEMSGNHPGAQSEIGVYCHEFGHALGLPDLYDTSQLGGAGNIGPGNWSLMASGGFGTNGASPEYPAHLGAWPMLFLGWRQSVRPDHDTPLRLTPLETGGDIVEFWFQGENNPEHFLLENREPLGFDRNIPNRGMIVYHVDEAAIGARLSANRINVGLTPGLRLVEADGDTDLVVGRNRGDGLDPFPGGLQVRTIDEDTNPGTQTFLGGVTNLAIRDIALDGWDVTMQLQVEAPGWEPIADYTSSDFQPLEMGSPPGLVADGSGTVYTVRSELRSGRSQVVLRSGQGDVWAPSFQVSQSTGVALDPTIVALESGDLVVVWSDTREGSTKLYYRARIGGAWTAEQRMTNLPGDARNPSLAAASDGSLHMAWLQLGGTTRIMFMRFLYTSPFGMSMAVTDSTLPGAPVLAPRPDGGSYIAWTERALLPPQIQFARFHPDSAISAPRPLAPLGLGSQSSPQVVVAPDGTVHSVWLESGPGLYRIRYQHRQSTGFPSPPDQVLASYGNSLENLVLRLDPGGSLHMIYERNLDGELQLRYHRWRESYGWDGFGTNVTDAAQGDATFPGMVATGSGHVTVLFTAHPGGEPRFQIRRRSLDDPSAPVAVEPPALVEAGMRIYPNPMRAGSMLRFRRPDAAAGQVVDVFDVSGRRVGSASFGTRGLASEARFEPSTTARWATGIYFARVRGAAGPTARIIVLR